MESDRFNHSPDTVLHVSEGSQTNPYLPPQTTSERVKVRSLHGRPWSRYLGAIQVLVVAVGAPLAFWEIITILASGAILTLVGLAMAIMAYREKNYWTLALGGAAVSFTIFVFVVINAFGWGPPEAAEPVSLIIAGFSLLFVPPLLFAVIRSDRTTSTETPQEP